MRSGRPTSSRWTSSTPTTTRQNTLDLYLAFTTSPATDFSPNLNAGPAMVVELRNPGGGQRAMTFTNRDTSTTGNTFPNSSGYVLNEWYRLQFSLNRQADSGGFAQYQAVFTQWSLGATGTAAPTMMQ